MRRTVIIAIYLTICLAFAGCHGDSGDGVMERPDYTSIDYKLTVSSEILKFYDVAVTYVNIAGEKKTDTLTIENWRFTEKNDGYYNTNFILKAVATAKATFPRLAESIDEYILTCEYSAEYYTKPSSAVRRAQKTVDTTVKKANIATYVQEHPTLSLANFERNEH